MRSLARSAGGTYTASTRPVELTPWQRLIVWLKQIKGRDTAALDYWSGELRIVEHRVSAEDPTRADDHARPILTVPQPQPTHNTGWIGFGPDAYLYVGLGDGGGADDSWEGHAPEGNGQATDRLLGKILRIDVDAEGAEPYGIPPDNPFVDQPDYRPEIWALGFRNPWRCGFDGDRLFCGDVGQNDYEEVSIVEKGRNYGWRRKEGRACFDVADPHVHPPTCPDADLTDPIIAYRNCTGLGDPCVGRSAVGGYVYRGAAVPELWGQYVFGDFAAGPDMERGLVMRAAPPDWTPEPLRLGPADQLGYVVAFAQDLAGEIYVMTSRTVGTDTTDDRIYRIGRQPPEREGAM